MSQILIITAQGKFEAKPFTINNAEAMTSADMIESIPVGTNETNQEETEVSPDAQASDYQTDDSN